MDSVISMGFTVEIGQETDGRWIAEIAALPGCLAYGATSAQASAKVKALALRVLAERMKKEDFLSGINRTPA